MSLDAKYKVIMYDQLETLTPELVAEFFAEMASDEQARFFNHVDQVASNWRSNGDGCLAMQLQYITDDDGLTLAGRRVMAHIGEYSHWGLAPECQRANGKEG